MTKEDIKKFKQDIKKLKTLEGLIKQAFTLEQLENMNVPENEINDYMKFQVFPIAILVKASWNYKEENEQLTEKLISNLKLNGQVENIQVRLLDTGYYEVVNGNHRLDAMLSLGREFIVCYNHGSISDNKAKRIAIETNETKFATDNVKLAELISEIGKEFSVEELTSTMPYTEEELNNFNDLSEFGWKQDDFKQIVEDNINKNDKDLSDKIVSTFKIEIILDNESQQKDLYDEFIERGLQCKLLTL